MTWSFETDPRLAGATRLGTRLRRQRDRAAGVLHPQSEGSQRSARPRPRLPAQGTGEDQGPVGVPSRTRARWARIRTGEAGAAQRGARHEPLGAEHLRRERTRQRQQRDPRPLRHARTEGAVPDAAARRRTELGVRDDRAALGCRPEDAAHPRDPRRRRVGNHRREVVRLERPQRRLLHHVGRHRPGQPAVPTFVDVDRSLGHARRRVRPPRRVWPTSRPATATRATSGSTGRECPRRTCSATGDRRSSSHRRGSAEVGCTSQCAPSASSHVHWT